MTDEELHEIAWTIDYLVRLTREEITAVADSPDGVTDEYREACREWLANNPQGMTRDEFDALPDGSVVEVYNSQSIKVGSRGAYTNTDRMVGWVNITDNDLPHLSVVSTPAPPTLDDVEMVLDRSDNSWRRINDESWWSFVRSARATTTELLDHYGPLTPLLPGPQIGGEA